MATYKNIKIKKKGGGTRLQRVQVLASGKYKFVKNVGSSKKKVKKKGNPKSKGSKKKMAKRRNMTIPIAPIVGILAAPAISSAIPHVIAGNWQQAINDLKGLVGIDYQGQVDISLLGRNLLPIIAGIAVHKFLGKAINPTLGRAGVPILRL